jgi:hypothetical protein
MMKKKEAVSIFGNVKNLAEAIGTSKQNFYMFSDPLSRANSDRIVGAAIRNGFEVPEHLMKDAP